MEQFFANLSRVLTDSAFRSLEELSAAALDGNKKYLANAMKKNQKISLEKAARISSTLGVSLDRLVSETSQPHQQDLIVPLLVAVAKSRDISDLGGMIDYVDLYHQIKDTDKTLRPYKLGKKSLLTKILQRRDISNLKRGLKNLDPAIDAKLLASYQAAAAGVPVLSTESFNAPIAIAPFHVSVTYARLLLSVHGPRDLPLILSYCYELSQS